MPVDYWCSFSLRCSTFGIVMCDFAALKRKGKGSDVEEADMEAVVHAHNSKHSSSVPALTVYETSLSS